MFDELEIFKGKSFSGLLKDIYKNSADKEKQIKILIGELRPLIKNIGDAMKILRKGKKFPLGGAKGLFVLPWKAVVGGIIANVATYFLYFVREPFEKLEILGNIIPSLSFLPEAILVSLGCAAGSIVTTYPQCV